MNARIRYIVIIFLLVAASRGVVAQNTYADRITIAGVLNIALDTLATRIIGDSVPVTFSPTLGTIQLGSLFAGCRALSSTDTVWLKKVDASNFSFSVRIPAPDTMRVPSKSHQMVCDLNDAWLNRVWWKTMVDSIGDHVIGHGWECNTCESTLNINHRFFMCGTFGANPDERDSLQLRYGYIDPWIATKVYSVVDCGGATINHNPLVRILNDNFSPFTYIGFRSGPTDDSTMYAHRAHSRIDFATDYMLDVCGGTYSDGDTTRVLKAVEMTAYTQAYASDCSWISTPDGEPKPRNDSAAVVVRWEFLNHIGGTIIADSCVVSFKGAAGGTPDQRADTNNQALWSFMSTSGGIYNLCRFDIDTLGYLIFIVDSTKAHFADSIRVMRLRDPSVPPLYCMTGYPSSGKFCIDSMNGNLTFRPSGDCSCTNCVTEIVPCLEFCTPASGTITVDNVISSSAVELDDHWQFDSTQYYRPQALTTWQNFPNTTNNVYETGVRGHWMPRRSYVYRTAIKNASGGNRVYENTGIYLDSLGQAADAFQLFDWKNAAMNGGTPWLKVDSVTQVSPHGEPLEQSDIMDFRTAANFSHDESVPRLVARNARVGSVDFKSFEDKGGNAYRVAHTGQWSYKLPSTGSSDPVLRVILDHQLKVKGLLIRVWVKRLYSAHTDDVVAITSNVTTSSTFTRIAKTGAWSLYELQAPDAGSTITVGDTLAITFSTLLGAADSVWIDDARVQPLDAEMKCYVYDRYNLRLIAQFDEQHFAALYQYNGEGKLVRTLVETERGVKTVAETQYHVPLLVERTSSPGAWSAATTGPSIFSSAALRRGVDIDMQPSNGLQAKGELLRLDLDENGPRMTMLEGLGFKDLSVDSLVSLVGALFTSTTNRIGGFLGSVDGDSLLQQAVGSGAEKVADAKELMKVEGALHDAESSARDAADSAGHARATALGEELKQRRTAIMGRLGLSEQQVQNLYDACATEAAKPKNNEGTPKE
jgi:hypothetical protein